MSTSTQILSKKLQAKIDTRNKLFRAANDAEKRVLIAKDILSMMKSKKIVAATGKWVHIDENLEYEASLQTCLLDNKLTCQCCALGSIMVSLVAFKNNITGEDYYHDYLDYIGIHQGKKDKLGIKTLFGEEQLQLIEVAYEQGSGCFAYNNREKIIPSKLNIEEYNQAARFGKNKDDNKKRLIEIMQNIIDNNGTFVI